MSRLIGALFAFLLLSGFSEQDAFDRFAGNWQMADPVHGSAGALTVDGHGRSLKVIEPRVAIDGPIDQVELVGASAIFHIGSDKVITYPGDDEGSIRVQIGDQGVAKRFVRVP